MLNHFVIEVRDDGMDFRRDGQIIESESRLDGIYVIRTDIDASDISPDQAVQAYKSLSNVERAFC